MRKLASIQKIEKLEEIAGADRILKATVLGWNLVVKKEEFEEGDLCVYFEIDSVLDISNPAYSHLIREGKLKYLRTIKLKGQVSQGLALPLSCLNHYGKFYTVLDSYENHVDFIYEFEGIEKTIVVEIGADVTEITKTVKHEPYVPACLSGLAKGNFPSFLKKTDEPRIQNFPGILDEVKGKHLIGTLKCDGTSTTFYLKDDEFGVCSRNLNLKETEDNSQWIIARRLDIEKKMRDYREKAIYHGWSFKDFAIQGELVGPGIQANKMGLANLEIFFFNFWDITNHKYRSFETLDVFCREVGLKTVPVVYNGVLEDDLCNVGNLLRYAERLDYPLSRKPAEGIVWRTLIEEPSPLLGERTSFKTISNRFLLKNEE